MMSLLEQFIDSAQCLLASFTRSEPVALGRKIAFKNRLDYLEQCSLHEPHAFLLPRSLSRRWRRSPKLPCPLRVGVRFWASLTLRKLANASGRIVFNIALFMDWQFISGCLPPRLSTTQFPSTTDSQCSVRWGLPPHGWCALSGARRDALPRDPRRDVRW